jgi:hypothetical protein
MSSRPVFSNQGRTRSIALFECGDEQQRVEGLLRCRRALLLPHVMGVRDRGERDARRRQRQRASGVGGRRDAEHAAAARSRKARAAIGTPPIARRLRAV